MVINVPVADLICQIFVDNQKYYKRYKKEYRYLKHARKVDLAIKIRNTDLQSLHFESNRKQTSATLYFPYRRFKMKDLMFLSAIAVSTLSIKKDINILHASSIVVNERAYVFCGESGVGKSTVIKLAKDCIPLSDDTTIIKKEKNKYFVYPSNFDKRKCKNLGHQKALLGKIFVLQKAKKTQIKTLSSIEIVEQIINNNLIKFLGSLNYKKIIYQKSLDLVANITIQKLFFTKSREFLSLIK